MKYFVILAVLVLQSAGFATGISPSTDHKMSVDDLSKILGVLIFQINIQNSTDQGVDHTLSIMMEEDGKKSSLYDILIDFKIDQILIGISPDDQGDANFRTLSFLGSGRSGRKRIPWWSKSASTASTQ